MISSKTYRQHPEFRNVELFGWLACVLSRRPGRLIHLWRYILVGAFCFWSVSNKMTKLKFIVIRYSGRFFTGIGLWLRTGHSCRHQWRLPSQRRYGGCALQSLLTSLKPFPEGGWAATGLLDVAGSAHCRAFCPTGRQRTWKPSTLPNLLAVLYWH